MTILIMLGGLITLIVGAEILIRSASGLAKAFGVPPLVIGLTIIAFGTSTPELSVSIASALNGEPDIALGNVVGSNLFNVLFILGLSALIIPLEVHQKLIRFDVPLMIILSLIFWWMAFDMKVSRFEGGLLCIGLVVYTAWSILAGRSESSSMSEQSLTPSDADLAAKPFHFTPTDSKLKDVFTRVIFIVAGLALLVLGAKWFVSGASEVARWLGASDLMIGLTIVACGTSLPEVATSVVAAFRGERDIAVGNVVGSNIFNILGVLGGAALVSPQAISVVPQALQFDIPVMVAATAACLPIFFTGHIINRWEGGIFLTYFVAYLSCLLLIEGGSINVEQLQFIGGFFVFPLTMLTLFVVVLREVRSRGRNPA